MDDVDKYEYKTHYVRFDGPLGERETVLMKELNTLGQDGWRLNRMYSDFKLRTLRSWGGGLNLLLEREISG
jgi:hypothetical protein